MSVIVKGMRLPNCCAECELSESDDEGIYCNVLEEFMRFDELPKGRRSDCPIFDENTETLQSIVLNDRYGNVAEYAKVIRCRDCAHYDISGNGVNGYCRNMAIPFDSYEWCSRAVRKEEKR